MAGKPKRQRRVCAVAGYVLLAGVLVFCLCNLISLQMGFSWAEDWMQTAAGNAICLGLLLLLLSGGALI